MKPRQVPGLDPAAPLRVDAALIVSTRLLEVRQLGEGAQDPAALRAQHNLRIACKRLRYVLELVGPCFGPEAAAAAKLAKELQGVLGELHDCDVMLPRAAGIPSLETLLRTRRELLFKRFVELWREPGAATLLALERSL